MELDDFKKTWNDLGQQATTKNVNAGEMDRLVQQKLFARFKRIWLPEFIGSAVCIFGAGYTWYYFERLDQFVYQVAGIIAIALLLILPAISLLSVLQLYAKGNFNGDYASQLRTFSAQKIEFCRLQKINVFLSNLLLVAVILLSARIFGRNTITDSKYYFIVAFSAGYIFLLFFSSIVLKTYNRVMKQYEEVLREVGR